MTYVYKIEIPYSDDAFEWCMSTILDGDWCYMIGIIIGYGFNDYLIYKEFLLRFYIS